MAVQAVQRSRPATGLVRPWLAVDVDVEARLDREVSKPVGWRTSLMRWLIEFNRY
ncbi:MAG: hypothetical protein ACRDIY_06030 [Chloroflexota bacterium]